jgi:hypothetical protein
MALPALALGWLLVASAPAVKYKASARVESVVRTPLLTESAPSPVVNDVILAPRLDSVIYTNLLEVKFVYEPQFLVRQLTVKPNVELLQSVYARADYKLRRDLSLLAVHTTTYGNFPADSLGDGGAGNAAAIPIAKTNPSSYIYTETAAGFWTNLGIKRLAVAGTLGFVVNGLLDPPVRPARRGNAAYPQQRYPELRFQANYGATRRDYVSFSVYGRDVSFSTGHRDAVLHLSPGLQHQFTPLINLTVEPGLALGRVYPRLPGQLPQDLVMPILESTLKAPVPLGHHWPVKAKVRAKYLPYMDPLTTRLLPRGELGLELEWLGKREAKVLGKLRYSQPFTTGLHRNDAQAKAELEALWPLPLSRYLYFQGKGQLSWTRHEVLSEDPIVQWFTSVGLVVRYDRGRL